MSSVKSPIHRSESYEYIGSRIASARAAAGMAQATLAEAIGLTRTSISNIEKGRQKMLVHTLLDIARALSVQPTELLPTPYSLTDDTLRFSGSEVSPIERARISALLTSTATAKRDDGIKRH